MSDIPKFIEHFRKSAAYHRKKAEQAEAEVARLEVLLSGVRPSQLEEAGEIKHTGNPYTCNHPDCIALAASPLPERRERR